MNDFELLKKLVSVRGTSGDESRIKSFLIDYIIQHKNDWETAPRIYDGDEFQDALILVFGEPRTAVFAHIDTIGFTVGYDNELIRIGGPRIIDGCHLEGEDRQGKITTDLMVIEQEDGTTTLKCISDRTIERGTALSFAPNFRETDEFIQSPYLDNRLGVWSALQLCKTLENGAIVFSTYEEHGGGSVGFLGKFLLDKYNIRQALISDITWVTKGVKHGEGVALSLRDQGIPRKTYIDRIIQIAEESSIDYQLEVESAGGSDGTALQKSDLPFDWCFIGAPEDHVHTPDEKVHKHDITAMVNLYKELMQKL